MGRKFYHHRKRSHRSSGGLALMLLGALAGRRSSHYRPAPYRRSSLKSSLIQTVIRAILKKILR